MAWTTLVIVKSKQYLDMSADDNDTDIQRLIDDVSAQMVSYVDNSALDAAGNVELRRACAKQVSYEWKRRKDAGLSSVTYPDGNVNKYQIDEWLPDVQHILDRNRQMDI